MKIKHSKFVLAAVVASYVAIGAFYVGLPYPDRYWPKCDADYFLSHEDDENFTPECGDNTYFSRVERKMVQWLVGPGPIVMNARFEVPRACTSRIILDHLHNAWILDNEVHTHGENCLIIGNIK